MSKDSETTNQPPGFMIPGPNGQPVFAPISAYNHGRIPRDPAMRSTGSPSRAGSRSASISSRQAQTPPRVSPPRDFPGAFPSGSPVRYSREPTPPLRQRPSSSSSSRQSSLPEVAGAGGSQPVRLVPFPVTDYQHYSAEPYQYYSAGAHQPSSSQPSSSQPQYSRRVASGPADYTSMPRRVPVPVQRASAGVHSYSDPILERPELQRGASGASDGPEVLVDVVPEDDNRQGYKVQTQTSKGSGSSSKGDIERRRRSGRSRRK
ncbi:hypothetical protein BDV96DRAFT_162528 [Lophiotrema nucula]|uniref:Uncharacterized protein n=1 Tax=Lophiotrema nucula TaxID=690887 RepID=A0A6A5YZZ0_9PLEO|nr:hypothetical protein BDV96DRAFT_162528 [Lophiotrema nucula]